MTGFSENIRKQFPILDQKIHGKRLVYLDSAATCLKPLCVINAEREYELEYSANIHRGIHALSERASFEYDGTRKMVREFIGAKSQEEIVFTKGTTESINLVAYSWGRKFLKAGDEIWISSLEHHANIIPWQVLCEELGCVLKVIDLNHTGEINFSKKSKLLALSYASNALGVKNPINNYIQQARVANKDIKILIDGAQAIPHEKIDLQKLDCDFFVFSAHKAYGPTGVGVLYARDNLFDSMNPYQCGGDIIERVSFEKSSFKKGFAKFEAGTPNISGVIGFKSAIKFIESIREDLSVYEHNLYDYAVGKLEKIEGFKYLPFLKGGKGDFDQLPIISFELEGAHPHDIASILDQEGVAIRAGHMCAMPLMNLLAVPALTRASLAAYNTREDIDVLVSGLNRVKQVLKC